MASVAESVDAAAPAGAEDEDVVDPFNVSSKSKTGIDYAKLIVKFGSQAITEDIIARLERVTNTQVSERPRPARRARRFGMSVVGQPAGGDRRRIAVSSRSVC